LFARDDLTARVEQCLQDLKGLLLQADSYAASPEHTLLGIHLEGAKAVDRSTRALHTQLWTADAAFGSELFLADTIFFTSASLYNLAVHTHSTRKIRNLVRSNPSIRSRKTRVGVGSGQQNSLYMFRDLRHSRKQCLCKGPEKDRAN
jgi:hypothetical protein